ncbi:helix-turn-helix domain-containing protein [Hoylesella saccharolytica]|jgi:putative response regulator|uniref:helix-turn-helix domain-containing protein n=1 Tax=Hoylesella saccharolytica TaxID=633701 RepID=UPI00047026D7|nr:helix-turn-helix domain-containing protein [Hoylesella saccharolytica]
MTHSTEKGIKKSSGIQISPKQVEILGQKILQQISVNRKFKDRNYSAKQLAQDLGTNTRYISLVIRRKFESNYTSFINKHRIQEALALLSDKNLDNLTVADIAEAVGFSTRQAFYVSFNKIIGMSPKEYRESLVVKKH